jgi:hypothetical protein
VLFQDRSPQAGFHRGAGDIPESLQREIGVGPAEDVTFTQISATSYSYRDAVRFRKAAKSFLQLREGQQVLVR